MLQEQGLIAERVHGVDVVTDEQNGLAPAPELLDAVEGLQREPGIADRQRLVDDQDVGVDRGGHGEGQPGLHAARIGPERLVDHVAQLGEIDDLVKAAPDLLPAQPEAQPAQEDVVASAVLRVKSGPEFQDRGDPAAGVDLAAGRLQRAGDEAEEGAFPGPVASQHTHNAATRHRERDTVERPKLGVPLAARQALQEHVARPPPDLEDLGEVGDVEGEAAHRAFPKPGFRARNVRHPRAKVTTAVSGNTIQP